MRAYIVRHGQSEENIADLRRNVLVEEFRRLIEASRDSALTELGIEQARACAAQLAGRGITHIYASPYRRAQQTAAAIGERVGLPVITVDELREIHPLMPPLLRQGRLRSVRSLYIRGYLRQLWPGATAEGETWWQARQRIAGLWTRLSAEWLPSSRPVLVGHLALIWNMLSVLSKRPGWRVLRRDLSNAGISEVEQC